MATKLVQIQRSSGTLRRNSDLGHVIGHWACVLYTRKYSGEVEPVQAVQIAQSAGKPAMDLRPGTKTFRMAEVKFADLDLIRRALNENSDWYQDLVEHSQDLLCIHDLQGRLLAVNPAPARVLGYSVEELLKIPMREMIVPEYRPDFDAYLKDIAITGESHGWMGVVTRSGEQRIWEYHNTLRTEGVASPIVRGMARDVTEQRRAEKLAHEANEILRNKRARTSGRSRS